jgi:hypothetical protein
MNRFQWIVSLVGGDRSGGESGSQAILKLKKLLNGIAAPNTPPSGIAVTKHKIILLQNQSQDRALNAPEQDRPPYLLSSPLSRTPPS